MAAAAAPTRTRTTCLVCSATAVGATAICHAIVPRSIPGAGAAAAVAAAGIGYMAEHGHPTGPLSVDNCFIGFSDGWKWCLLRYCSGPPIPPGVQQRFERSCNTCCIVCTFRQQIHRLVASSASQQATDFAGPLQPSIVGNQRRIIAAVNLSTTTAHQVVMSTQAFARNS